MAEWSYFFAKSSIPRHATNYRVIVKNDDVEIEVGSIGVQFDGWHWGIDSIVPMTKEDAEGSGKDRADCMQQFRAAWDKFSADPARLSDFLETKRKWLR